MRRFVFLCALLAAAIAIAPAAHSQNYRSEYKLSTVLPSSYPWGKAGERWAELVKEKTHGRINIKMYPGMSLVGGDQTKEFSALRQGVIDLAIGSTINWSPQVKQLNLFSLPFLMPDYKAIDPQARTSPLLLVNGMPAWASSSQKSLRTLSACDWL